MSSFTCNSFLSLGTQMQNVTPNNKLRQFHNLKQTKQKKWETKQQITICSGFVPNSHAFITDKHSFSRSILPL